MPVPTSSIDLTGGEFVERSWRCTARGGRYLAVGFADDDENGMTGRPLRMACIGNIDIVAVMVAWADSVDPGMRRFGFNPFGRDVADEIHADLLRMVADGSIRPSIGRRVAMEEAGAALDEHRGRRVTGSDRGRDGPVSATGCRAMPPTPLTTPGATPSSTAHRSRPQRGGPCRQAAGPGDADRWRPASVVKAAVRQAGSSDLGSDSYREPLGVFLRSCEAEAELTTFGRILVTKMLSAALANRIELHHWAQDHPAIRRETIASPWIIVGLPRTGTSVLSNLLGLDPMARPLRQWEAAHLIPPPTLEGAEEDPRIARTAKELEGLMRLNPPLRAMHPFGATLAQECVSLFMYDVRTLALETQAHVPTYARWLEQADMAPAYAQHKLALQALQSAQPTERWILKTPNHLWHLEALVAAYPDARIIWTHRDPGPVVTSLASLANAGQRPLTSRADPRPAAEEWKRKCAFALGSAVALTRPPRTGGASTSTTTT